MSTAPETVEFILSKLGEGSTFRARAMFGEYALYAKDKVVALICDDQLYVKILPESAELDKMCEKGEPYPGAKPHYIVDESLLTTLSSLPHILIAVAASLPEKKSKKTKSAQPKNPMHGVTLRAALEYLVATYGWEDMSRRIRINCFANDPSINSSLTFLRRTPWARTKVERLYLAAQRAEKRSKK